MTAPTTTPEMDRYLAAVRAALADLSTEDRDDLMEDVASHLAEVAAEGLGSLEARLGKPADYAAELRSSAGLPVAGSPARLSWRTGLSAAIASSPIGRGMAAVAGHRQFAAFRAFLAELRPAWWVFRGYLVVWLLASGHRAVGVIPRLGGSALLGLLVTIAAIWASVRLGRHWQARPPGKVWVALGTAGAVLVTAFFLTTGWSPDSPPNDIYSGPPPGSVSDIGSLTNIYVFDSEGHPLSGVQLFDQDGRPIDVTQPVFDPNGGEVPMRPIFNAAGQPVSNVFPREPASGTASAPPIAPPRLAPSASSTVAPSPSPTPSPSPR